MKQSLRRKRRRNQATRFLTKRQAALHPSNYTQRVYLDGDFIEAIMVVK